MSENSRPPLRMEKCFFLTSPFIEPHVFARFAARKTFRGVATARVGAINRAMCFVMRLVVGP